MKANQTGDTQAAPPSATDVNTTQGAPSAPLTPASDPAYMSGLQDVINKTLGTTPSQGEEEGKPEDQPQADPAAPEGEPQTPAPDKEDGEGEPIADPSKKEGEEEGEPTDPKAEDKKPVPYERFNEVITEKNTLAQQVQEMQPVVQAYMGIENFLNENNISNEEFQAAMRLAAAKKNAPQDYLKMLEPDIAQVKAIKGEVLDPDLQAAVTNAEITAEWAQKVQAGRAKEVLQQRHSQATQDAQQRRQMAAYQATMTSAITDWVKAKQTADTEFQPSKAGKLGLHEMFAAQLAQAAQRANPQTPEQAKALCDQVYAQVKPLFKPQPSKPNGVHVRTSQSTASPNGRKITSLQDAVRAGIDAHNRAVARGV